MCMYINLWVESKGPNQTENGKTWNRITFNGFESNRMFAVRKQPMRYTQLMF